MISKDIPICLPQGIMRNTVRYSEVGWELYVFIYWREDDSDVMVLLIIGSCDGHGMIECDTRFSLSKCILLEKMPFEVYVSYK